jgi:hypothetical protein
MTKNRSAPFSAGGLMRAGLQSALVLLAMLACLAGLALVALPDLWPHGVLAELLPSPWLLAPLALLTVGALLRVLFPEHPVAGLTGAFLASLVALAWFVLVDWAMANPYDTSPSLAIHLRGLVRDLRFWGYAAVIVLCVVSLPSIGYSAARGAQWLARRLRGTQSVA